MPDIVTYDLAEAILAPGCPLCRVLAEAERAFIASFAREGRFAPAARRRFMEAGGYCRQHAWLLHAAATDAHSGMPVVDLYERLAERDVAHLRALAGELAARRLRRPRVARGRRRCPACAEAESRLHRKAAFLLDLLTEEPARRAYLDSDGLCLDHLGVAVEAAVADRAEIAKLLIEHWCRQASKIRRLLAEYDRKRDYRYAHEPKGDEQHSWTDVVRLYVGEPLDVGPHP